MTDDRQSQTTGATGDPSNPYEGLDDEYHSTIEFDDSSGWRPFLVPGILVLFLIGALALTFMSGSGSPDPRIADRIKGDPAAEQISTEPRSAIAPPTEAQVPDNVQTPDQVQPAEGGLEPQP
jgi:hypothetical protein